MDGDAVIVEVALNEAVGRGVHPHVPQSPTECARDALRGADAGACVVHWHAVDAGGVQRLGDASLYGEALDVIARRIPAYPSYPIDVDDTVDDRLAPFEPAPGFDVIRNSLPFVVDALGRYRAAGLVVPYGMRDAHAFETLARAALARGGGVRIGIGDNPLAFPDATNPDLVGRVARWARDEGRPLASISELRTRLGLTRPYADSP